MSAATQAAGALLTVVVLAASWLTIGWRAIRPVRVSLLPSERLSLALLAGAGLSGVALFLVGQLWFSAAVVVAVTALGFLPLLSRRDRRELLSTWRALQRPALSTLLLIVPLLALMTLAGLARPVGDIGDDAISYHLFGPLMWMRHHHVIAVPDTSHTAFPVAIEALFGAAMALANDRAPGVVGMVLAVAVVTQAYGLARWLGAGPRWAELASVLLVFMPPLIGSAPHAFVDVEYAGFALAAFRLMFARDTERSLVGPLFLGLAVATKYNGLTLAALTLALAAVRLARREGTAPALRFSLPAAVTSGLFALPYLIRNAIVFGTPIYPPPPALARLLPVKTFPYSASVAYQNYVIHERGEGLGRGILDFLLLPWRLTFYTSNFHGAGGIGIATLAFFPAMLLGRRDSTRGWALAWILGNALVWFIVQQETRFLAAFVILATAMAVAGGETLVTEFPRWGRAAVGLTLAISIGYGGIILGRRSAVEGFSVLSARADARRWNEEVPFHQAFDYLNGLPEPCRVLVLSYSVPPYFLAKDYVKIDGLYHERPVAGIADAETALSRLDELHVTHVLDVRPPSSQPRGGSLLVPMPPPAPLKLVLDTPDARVFAVQR